MIKAPLARCEICTLSSSTVVLPKLDKKKKIALIGEAPGFEEVFQGLYFIGDAGKKLAQIFTELDFDIADVNLLNSVICHPVMENAQRNRTPTEDEIKCCNDRLLAEIDLIKPEKIVLLGKTAYLALGGDKNDKMFNIVGTRFKFGLVNRMYDVTVTYHPSKILYGDADGSTYNQIKNDIGKALRTAKEYQLRFSEVDTKW